MNAQSCSTKWPTVDIYNKGTYNLVKDTYISPDNLCLALYSQTRIGEFIKVSLACSRRLEPNCFLLQSGRTLQPTIQKLIDAGLIERTDMSIHLQHKVHRIYRVLF